MAGAIFVERGKDGGIVRQQRVQDGFRSVVVDPGQQLYLDADCPTTLTCKVHTGAVLAIPHEVE